MPHLSGDKLLHQENKIGHLRHFAKRNQIAGPRKRENGCVRRLILFASSDFGQKGPENTGFAQQNVTLR